MTSMVAPPPKHATTVETTFRVMGTDAHIIVVEGPPDAVDGARARLDELESRWSRFRPDSELCRINARSGRRVVISDLTFALVERACAWWSRLDGRFDPTVLSALERAGYDRTFDDLDPADPGRNDARAGEGPGDTVSPGATPGCGGIELDPVVRAVTLPPGVRIDLGGIAKGFAADLVAADILRSGAAGVCVNLGGDLRVAGQTPEGNGGWVVAVDGPPGHDRTVPALPGLHLADGAVATTSRALRAWRHGSSTEHHIIDPRIGRPAMTPWISATVIAGRAGDAEPLAKAALLSPTIATASTMLTAHDATGLLIDPDGRFHPLPGVDTFLVENFASS